MNPTDPENDSPPPTEAFRKPPVASRAILPGILLVIIGLFNLAVGSLMIIQGVRLWGEPAREWLEELERSAGRKLTKPDVTPEDVKAFFLRLSLIGGPLAVLGGGITVSAGMALRKLKRYRLALLGAALAVVPGVSPMACCGVGEAVGVWALVVLFQADVRAAFSKRWLVIFPAVRGAGEPA
jgi:hypothetical protein